MSKFEFELGDKAKMAMTAESGVIIGRAEYDTLPPSYLMRFVAADGRQVEDWFKSEAIAKIPD